jgi:hypothetical protein
VEIYGNGINGGMVVIFEVVLGGYYYKSIYKYKKNKIQ